MQAGGKVIMRYFIAEEKQTSQAALIPSQEVMNSLHPSLLFLICILISELVWKPHLIACESVRAHNTADLSGLVYDLNTRQHSCHGSPTKPAPKVCFDFWEPSFLPPSINCPVACFISSLCRKGDTPLASHVRKILLTLLPSFMWNL